MDILKFLKPTAQKIIATFIILLAIFAASSISGVIFEILMPEEWLTKNLDEAIIEILEKDFKMLMILGFKMIAINFLITETNSINNLKLITQNFKSLATKNLLFKPSPFTTLTL